MEKLHNGIVLPDRWPPDEIECERERPVPVPYLDESPEVISIDVGRQLFVDDFLIGSTTLERSYHQAQKHEASPVLIPETELEKNRGECPVAAPFNDGVWFDPADDKFKMWYMAGWMEGTAYAESGDGIHWERPSLDIVKGTNRVLPAGESARRDGSCVWYDHFAGDPSERYKMFVFHRYYTYDTGEAKGCTRGGELYTSPDGIHWSEAGFSSRCGDNTTFFYNPFRRRWVFSMRRRKRRGNQRTRSYYENADFLKAARWPEEGPVFWSRTDRLDTPDPDLGEEPQIYDVNAVAYESIMLSLHAVLFGPQPNEVCKRTGDIKINELFAGFSRDGFHFHRPYREPLIAASREEGSWDCGYLHAAGGICLIAEDELLFYFGAWSGDSPKLGPGEVGAHQHALKMYAGGSTGLAVLRRDGFASMDSDASGGYLTTRPVCFSGQYLFVNVDAPSGELTVEVLDESGEPIAPFTSENCVPVGVDSTREKISWRGAGDLSVLTERPVCFRFHLREGKLYSFWVSGEESGISGGYVAAGGPGYPGARDI